MKWPHRCRPRRAGVPGEEYVCPKCGTSWDFVFGRWTFVHFIMPSIEAPMPFPRAAALDEEQRPS